MVRPTALLRNAANAAKPKPMSADHTKYHLAPTVSVLSALDVSMLIGRAGLLEKV